MFAAILLGGLLGSQKQTRLQNSRDKHERRNLRNRPRHHRRPQHRKHRMNYDQALAEYHATAKALYAFTKDLMAAVSPSYPHRAALNAAREAHNAAWDALRAAKKGQA